MSRVATWRTLAYTTVVVVLALMLSVPLRTYLGQRSEYHQLSAENSQLSGEVKDLQSQAAEQNDPAYIEREARSRLNYVMPGDKGIVVIPREPTDDDRRAAAERQRAKNTWYQNLWEAVATPPEGK